MEKEIVPGTFVTFFSSLFSNGGKSRSKEFAIPHRILIIGSQALFDNI